MTMLSTRLSAPAISSRTAVGIFILAALVPAGLLLTARHGDERVGPLGWSSRAVVFTHPTLPRDRLLTGTLRNGGLHPLRVDIGDVRLLAGDGTEVPSAPVFLRMSGRTLWAAGRGPAQVPDSELQRTGRIAFLNPGEEIALTVAWHAADGDPVRVDYGRGSLKLPG
jgi:hypothetical protein